MSPGSAATTWAWLGLGCNVGNRGRALLCLRSALGEQGLTLWAASAEVLTRPVGVTAQPDFHNQVLLVRSPEPWPPGRWLQACLAAERACGRLPTYHWGPRRADCDVVLLGRHGEVASPGDPEVPHPALGDRAFWHRLIAEIDPMVSARLRP